MFKKSSKLALAAIIGLSIMGASQAKAGYVQMPHNQGQNQNHDNNGHDNKDNNKHDDKGGDIFKGDKGDKGNKGPGGYGGIDLPGHDKGDKGGRDDKGPKGDKGGKDKDHHYNFCWNDQKDCHEPRGGEYGGRPVHGKGCEVTAVPLPAAAWSGMATLAGGVVVSGYRKARKLMA